MAYLLQPIKLKILATGDEVGVDSLTAIGFMRLGGQFTPANQIKDISYRR